ncbi:MAG TPA: UDP-N-acetylmuramoyl-L-alanyl-D-glutamate--2,6-diaminopimelate ligase [Acidimicrobiales bacterium]|nr:UDP-N-acetylmuramoyl-L-alanyl-D-glutamate--2,6-diaminopimelate ligase [Acidimicrobiales bacterium]
MQLASLLGGVDVLERRGDVGVEVRAVTHDSRQVTPGALFCCLPGSAADGHDHAPAAVDAGAVALLCERLLPLEVAQVRVDSTRRSMAHLAAAFHGHPSSVLRVAGVTGTNGKTTVTWLLRSIFEAHGWSTGLIGTLSGARTTPESTELQARLADLLAAGTEAVAMEVSSHALVQHRVEATRFAVVGFTNLSQDHLDYHGDMESYFAAKASLFTPAFASVGVANADDPWGRRLLAEAPIEMRPFRGDDVKDVRLRLGGSFNRENAACAAAVAEVLGVPRHVVVAGLEAVESVPGRFERVDAGQPFAVVVDYAHTPDALAQVLAAAREEAAGRVVVVFGCGGDRDRAKRPLMGRVAVEGGDLAILTDDNPRSEDAADIRAAVLAGVPHGRSVMVEPDRRAAIRLAVREAGAGDVVVIAGKGHETGQTFGTTTLPFDDRVVAREELEALA